MDKQVKKVTRASVPNQKEKKSFQFLVPDVPRRRSTEAPPLTLLQETNRASETELMIQDRAIDLILESFENREAGFFVSPAVATKAYRALDRGLAKEAKEEQEALKLKTRQIEAEAVANFRKQRSRSQQQRLQQSAPVPQLIPKPAPRKFRIPKKSVAGAAAAGVQQQGNQNKNIADSKQKVLNPKNFVFQYQEREEIPKLIQRPIQNERNQYVPPLIIKRERAGFDTGYPAGEPHFVVVKTVPTVFNPTQVNEGTKYATKPVKKRIRKEEFTSNLSYEVDCESIQRLFEETGENHTSFPIIDDLSHTINNVQLSSDQGGYVYPQSYTEQFGNPGVFRDGEVDWKPSQVLMNMDLDGNHVKEDRGRFLEDVGGLI